jgi:mannose-6-phosphate isomerase-like protein (cupin superfamily)
MEHKNFYQGNYEEEAEFVSTDPPKTKWWFVGHFIPWGGCRKTEAMGLKYWKFSKGEEALHKPKKGEPGATECTMIFKGSVRGTIDGEQITLSAGEYVIIRPNTPSNLIEKVLEEPLVGLTIKAPNKPDQDTAR